MECAIGIELRDHDQLPAVPLIPLNLGRVNPAYHLAFDQANSSSETTGSRAVPLRRAGMASRRSGGMGFMGLC